MQLTFKNFKVQFKPLPRILDTIFQHMHGPVSFGRSFRFSVKEEYFTKSPVTKTEATTRQLQIIVLRSGFKLISRSKQICAFEKFTDNMTFKSNRGPLIHFLTLQMSVLTHFLTFYHNIFQLESNLKAFLAFNSDFCNEIVTV